MSTKRGKSRSSGAISDKRKKDKKGSPEKSESESEKPELPLEYEYETEDGLKISLSPDEAEISREYQLSENDFVEFSAGIEISPIDWKVEKTGDNASVSGEVSLPGDILGLSGGVSVDLSTGEIIGGELGVEAGGVGVEVSVSGEDGCQKSVEISLFGVGVSYTRDECEPEENREKKRKLGPKEGAGVGEESSVEDFNRTWEALRSQYPGCTIRFAIMRTMIHTVVEPYIKYVRSDGSKAYSTRWHQRVGGNAVPELDYFNYSHWQWGASGTKTPPGPQVLGYRSYTFWRGILSGPIRVPRMTQRAVDSYSRRPWAVVLVFIDCKDSVAGNRTGQENIELLKRRIPPSPPPRRIMNDCCRDSMKLMREIHTHLGIPELRDKGVKFPNRLMASDARGYTKVDTMLDLMELMIREIDHLGIHPFKAKVTDVNAAQAGDQSVEMEFANATAAAKQIAELLLENKGDSATRLNLMMRTAIATGQILNVVSIVAKNIDNLINFIGMPIQEKIKYVKMPFDFTFGQRRKKNGKGFGKPGGVSQSGIDALDINTEEATEALLPKFMQDEEQPIVYKQFKPKQPDLIDIIKGK